MILWEDEINFQFALHGVWFELLLTINVKKNKETKQDKNMKTLSLVISTLEGLKLLAEILEKYDMPELLHVKCVKKCHFNKK